MTVRTGHASLIGATFGPYQVLALVGRGAMGTVYLARDTALKRHVALKVLLGHLARNPLLVRRFHREAQATARLRHPGIVRIYAAGVEAGTPYIAMEYVEGEPLDRFMRRCGRLAWQRALHIGEQVAEALAAAHAEGITHRDVKPANIMLDTQGRVRLTDFGIAQIHTELDESPEDSFLGTPRYMSPEQCANRDITMKTDLFSLGVVLHEMIVGELPFHGESAVALIKAIHHDEPPRLTKFVPGLPDDVARLVAHLLEKRPTDRPQSARDVALRIRALQAENGGRSALPDALTAFIRDQARPRVLPENAPTPAPPGQRVSPMPLERTRHPSLFAAVSCMVVLCGALLPSVGLIMRDRDMGAHGPQRLDSRFDPVSHVVQLPLPGFAIADLAWCADNENVLVWAEGERGTRAQGARGILRVNRHTGDTDSLMAPVTPATADAFFQYTRLQPVGYLPTTDGSGHLLTIGTIDRGDDHLLAHAVSDGRARARWVLPAYERHVYPWQDSYGAYALHPDGARLCIADGTRVIEYRLESDGSTSQERAFSTRGPVMAMAYASSGLLAIIEHEISGDARLVLADATDNLLHIAPALPGSGIAFSPDGGRLVFTGSDGRLQLLDTQTSTRDALTSGRVGRYAWHPSGAFFAALQRDADESAISLIDVSQPHRVTVVTRLAQVQAQPPALSPDGRMVAVGVASAQGIEIRVVSLDGSARPQRVAAVGRVPRAGLEAQ